MPIFARRRLGKMLDDLARRLDEAKTSDLLTRLEHRDTQNALSAEAELAMLWAIFQVADLEVEPQIEGSSKRPDAYSKTLFSSAPAIIEITGLSDDAFSGKDIMDRAANKMVSFADQVRKRAGRHLHFEFLEQSYWKDHRFHRERCVKRDFKLTPRIEDTLREWIFRSNPPEPQTIGITDNAIDVVVSWHGKEVLPANRTFCRMPAVAYDLEDNPIYKALKEKRKQLTKVRSDTLRCIFLVDVGCDLLRRPKPLGAAWEKGGDEIIRHSLAKLDLDIVCVFSPNRRTDFSFLTLPAQREMGWAVSCYDKRGELPKNEYGRLEQMAAILPKPQYEGYQARSLHAQRGFDPQESGQYLATKITTRGGDVMTIKISSRLFQEYMAGRIIEDEFRKKAFGNDRNFFEDELWRGHTINSVTFERGGTDEDDDYIVFGMDFDWSAAALKKPKASEA